MNKNRDLSTTESSREKGGPGEEPSLAPAAPDLASRGHEGEFSSPEVPASGINRFLPRHPPDTSRVEMDEILRLLRAAMPQADFAERGVGVAIARCPEASPLIEARRFRDYWTGQTAKDEKVAQHPRFQAASR